MNCDHCKHPQSEHGADGCHRTVERNPYESWQCQCSLPNGESEMSYSNLAGCKFCGNQKAQMTDAVLVDGQRLVRTISLHGSMRPPFYVCCEACGARGPLKPSVEQAEKQWNKVMVMK